MISGECGKKDLNDVGQRSSNISIGQDATDKAKPTGAPGCKEVFRKPGEEEVTGLSRHG